MHDILICLHSKSWNIYIEVYCRYLLLSLPFKNDGATALVRSILYFHTHRRRWKTIGRLSNRRYLESRSLYVIPKQTDNFARPFRHWHEKEGPIEMTSYAEPSHRITGQSFTMLIKLHQTTQCKVFNTLINDWPPPSLYQLFCPCSCSFAC